MWAFFKGVDDMKARVPAPKERVLLYGISEESERGQAIRKTISAFGMETKTISEDMLGQTVGWCAELPGFPMAEKEASELPEAPGAQEAMILCGLERKRLDVLLAAFQAQNLQVSLKAVLTEYNAKWPVAELLHELTKEHEAMLRQFKKEKE